MAVFAGKYVRTYFERDDFKIALFACTDKELLPPAFRGTEVVVKGPINTIAKEMVYEFQGDWIKDKKFGFEFQTCGIYKFGRAENKRALENYLCSSAFPGIGRRTAKKIVKAFGLDALTVIGNEPEKLLKIRGINADKLETIKNAYRKNMKYEALSKLLFPYGVSMTMIVKIVEKLGEDAEKMVRENPYCMLKVHGVGFGTCDKVAVGLGIQLDSYMRIKGCLLACLEAMCSRTGNTMIPAVDLKNETLRILNHEYNGSVDPARYDEVFPLIVERGHIVPRGQFVYLSRYDKDEHNIAYGLCEMLSHKLDAKPEKVKASLDEYLANSPIKLSENQQKAVMKSLCNRVSIITGGPGTGKTTITKGVIAVYKAVYGGTVTCMAPTGKAARRMSEATGERAHTIHSQLRLYDEDGNVNPEPLPSGLVVIDESSMVDNALMSKVVDAIDPKRNMLILIGDINQLPSVGAGDVLGQCIGSGVIPTSRLTEIFRQKGGSSIVDDAYKINSGDVNLIWDEKFQFVSVRNEDEAVNTIKQIYAKECASVGMDQVALLSPLRKTQNGRFKCVSDQLNLELQNAANPLHPSTPRAVFAGHEFRLNDRVMQWHNGEKSSNGDIGVITAVDTDDEDEPRVTIQWDNGNVDSAGKEEMKTITLAYAMSIHKSQGSEYKVVIIPILSNQECPLFKRNLLYTGVTRAKEKVYIISDRGGRAVQDCIHLTDSNIRLTYLAVRLRKWASSNSTKICTDKGHF